MSWIIGVDVGGTFTDFYALNTATGDVRVSKRLSTPGNPAEAILLGLGDLATTHDIDLAAVQSLGHGTTVGTNALIQRKGARIGVVTTRGFRDLLEIGRQTRPHMFDMFLDHPPPLAPAERRFEINERVTADASVLQPVELPDLARVVSEVGAADVQACAVCCLFSFIRPEHEREIGAALRAAYPELPISLSSDVQPEFREFERFSTTAINAYLQPVMTSYIKRLEDGLAEQMPVTTVGINQSSGGLMSPERARALPVRTALSGPAAGAVGAVHVAKSAGFDDVITLDMGGTSADVALIRDGRFELAFNRDVAGFPIRLPMVDIETVGAGGGSVAWFDRDGLLKVGPVSAGAEPGPACYGLGGTEPTVSDANLVLGRLSAGGLLGGSMALEPVAARSVLEDLAKGAGLDVERTAHGVVSVVVANMVRAIRTISVERGHDPRRFALMPFGGAGPLHARDVAKALGIDTIIVPLSPGIVCAQGLVVSDQKEDFVRGERTRVDDAGIGAVERQLNELERDATAWFDHESVANERRRYEWRLDMRYVGQNFELPVTLSGGGDVSVDSLKKGFFDAHERSYGYFNPDDAVEMVNARLTAVAVNDTAAVGQIENRGDGGTLTPSASREVWFDSGQAVSAAVYVRETLRAGDRIDGPAVIDQLDATSLIYPGDSATVDGAGNIVIQVHHGG